MECKFAYKAYGAKIFKHQTYTIAKMSDKKLLIVGIDPGMTLGYAILDIEGNLIRLKSSKQLDLNLIISETVNIGKAVLVGTDKAKVPGFVESFAIKLGAKIVSPPEDLKVDEKRKMVSSFNFADEHQGDALASALFAYRAAKALLDRIDAYAKENRKDGIKDNIKELVLTKKISIKSAVNVIEKKDEEAKIIERVVSEKRINESDFLRLYDKLKKYEAEIRLVKGYNNSLKNKIEGLERQIKLMEIKKEGKRLADFREKRIRFLEGLIKLKEKEIEELKSLAKKSNGIISNIGNFYILKKLDTLGMNEFNFKNRILNIQKNDILIVDNPNIASKAVIDLLKNKIFVVVYKKPISNKVESGLPFVFINAKNLKIDENRYFGFIEKRHFEIEKSKVNWVRKIVEDYEKEKGQLA